MTTQQEAPGAEPGATEENSHRPDSSRKVKGAGFYGRITREALLDSRLSDRVVRCLAIMGTYADKAGYTHVGERTLAEDLGVSRWTIQGYLERLREAGHIIRADGLNQRGRRQTYLIPGLTKATSGRAAPHDSDHSQKESGRAEAPKWTGSPSQIQPEQVLQPEHDVDGGSHTHPDRPWQRVETPEEAEARLAILRRFRSKAAKASIEDGIVTFTFEVGPPELKWEVGQPRVVPYVEEDDDRVIWVEVWDGEQHAVIPPLEAIGA